MNAQNSLYGIIGNPLEHSLSPVMHNAAFAELGVDAEYKLFPLEESELEGFLKELKEEDSPIFGLNVTVPYKERVVPLMDNLSPLAKKVQAVNTIVVTKDRKLTGYNTDAPGFMAHLSELQVETADKDIVILGAGGSARAIICSLCIIPERPARIKIYNRTMSRIDDLLNELHEDINTSIVEPVSNIDELNIDTSDILINTTSVGLKEDDPCLVDVEQLHSGLFVYDLIYKPKETALLKYAKERGAKTANGLGMLFFQGILAFQHWADTQLDDRVKNVMREALEEAADNKA